MMIQDRAMALLIHRNKGFSIRRVLRQSAREYIFRILIAIAFLAVALSGKDIKTKLFSMAAFGVCFGGIARDVSLLRLKKKSWSFEQAIIDWKKVEAISANENIENESSLGASQSIAETAPAVASGNTTLLSRELSLTQCLVAGMGFFPFLGLPFALVALVWGFLIRRRRGAKLLILGAAGPILSFSLIFGIVALVTQMPFYGLSAKDRATSFLVTRLMSAGHQIEAFRKSTGRYPERLDEMAQSPRHLVVYDPFQPPQVVGGYEKQPTFYYQRLSNPPGYYLLSVGEDGKPFTSDDVLPTASKALPGLRLPRQLLNSHP